MSTSVSKTYEFARLAVASYALFDERDPVLALGEAANMTDVQSSDFISRYDLKNRIFGDRPRLIARCES